MKDVCEAYLFQQLPINVPPLLSYLMIAFAVYVTIPSSFIPFEPVRRFHQAMRIVNLVVTAALIFVLTNEFRVDESMALATNWTSFFTMPILAN
ncbi:MAG: hypothetical protein R3F54_12310 [Alphaproteobacteria bacterium]